ncbi:MAG: acyl carrier protein [Candidatus Binatia bacterium]
MAAAQEPDPAGDAPALHLLAAATGERRRALVVEWLAARAARVLGCEVERVERRASLREMGLDSLTSFELLNWAQEAFGVPLATSDLAHWPSVEDLADHILELRDAETPPPTLQMPARSAPQPAANAARSQDAVPEEVAAAP